MTKFGYKSGKNERECGLGLLNKKWSTENILCIKQPPDVVDLNHATVMYY